ncbi:MAG: hypothetical protein HRT44_10100 [Bdellovibrionales bacterium]|nr:hypothetical protein [Bdellovibrionales bacterium]NQZ19592.1 hypothetical protein [Bdellovibrionales bacterium]
MKFKLFFISLFFFPSLLNAQGEVTCSDVWSCDSYGTCSYCADTCNRCQLQNKPDPEYPKEVNFLPFNFNYAKDDDITSNDVCNSTACGTKNCNAGTTRYSENNLPARRGACELTPDNQMPATLNCEYRDGSCVTYCSRTETYSCCTSGSYKQVCS